MIEREDEVKGKGYVQQLERLVVLWAITDLEGWGLGLWGKELGSWAEVDGVKGYRGSGY